MPSPNSTSNPWLTLPSHSALVNIGKASLYASIAGPIPTTSTLTATPPPLTIIEAGLGDCSTTWLPTFRLLSRHARVLTYDRSGFGQSTDAPADEALTATQRVKDLRALLKATGLSPPYVLVGHSYGGALVREFLRQTQEAEGGKDLDDVVGMVIVDAMTCPPTRDMPDSAGELFAAEGDDAYAHVVGRDTNHVYSDEEWAVVQATEKHNEAAAAREDEHANASTNAVSEAMGYYRDSESGKCGFKTQPLGEHRLSCIFGSAGYDFRKFAENAEKRGVGSAEARREFRGWTEYYVAQEVADKRAALDLSRQSRWVEAEGVAATHNLHYTAPEVIVKEVLWALGMEGV